MNWVKRLRKISILAEKKIFSQEKCKQIHQWAKKLKHSDNTWANVQWKHVITGKLGQREGRSRGVGTLQGSVLPGHAQSLCSQGWQGASSQMLTWTSEPWHKTSEGKHPVLLSTQHKKLGLCASWPLAIMNLSALLVHTSLLGVPLIQTRPVPWQTFWGWRLAANTNHHLSRVTAKWQREKEFVWCCSAASVCTRSARVLLDLLCKLLIRLLSRIS